MWIASLTIPWSLPLMAISGLVAHMTVLGMTYIKYGMLIGVPLNILLYILIDRRIRNVTKSAV